MVATKKTAVKKRTVAKKSASKVPATKPPERDIDPVANQKAITSQDASVLNGGKPKIHAKTVSIIVSIGTEDRTRSMEDFIAEIEKRLKPVSYGKAGIHMTKTGAYYILDGKVCMPEDYDAKKGTFKKGSVPPVWAGGPKQTVAVSATQQQMQEDARTLSDDEYAKKYKLGKYRQSGGTGQLITPEMQAKKREEWIKDKQRKEDEALEEFDWDEGDVLDTKKMGKAADRKTAKAKRVIKSKQEPKPKKKTVVKKSASKKPSKTTGKRVVKRGKK